MPIRDNLGIRMKEFYENIPKTKLMRRTPVAIRIDGKAFHTFTRGFRKPFDSILMESMQETMKFLCENIQGCVLGYTQSDEITLLLIDYQKFTSSAWFDYEVQKVCSVAASMATMAFNKFFAAKVYNFGYCQDDDPVFETYTLAVDKGAMFDARCFNIPKEEACNLIFWRQLDATRNSIQMVGQTYFSTSDLWNRSCNEIQDMLMLQKNINWNDFSIPCKRGAACIRNYQDTKGNWRWPEEEPTSWVIDREMPILRDNDKNYINRLIFTGEGMD